MLSKFLLDFFSLFDEEAEDLLGVVFWARSEFIIQFCVFRAASMNRVFCFLFRKEEIDGNVCEL
jgi:hypothetical protein